MPSPKTLNNADAIRKWVAENFNLVGEFQTNDVAQNIEGVEVRALGNISAALQTWVDRKKIVNGLRLRRLSPPRHTAVWETFLAKPVSEASVEKAPKVENSVNASADVFIAEVVQKSPGGKMLVRSSGNGGLFKVEPFKF